MDNDIELSTPDQKKDGQDKAKEMYIDTFLLLGTDRNQYGKLIEDLKNEYRIGKDKYPDNINETYNFLLNYNKKPRNIFNMLEQGQEED